MGQHELTSLGGPTCSPCDGDDVLLWDDAPTPGRSSLDDVDDAGSAQDADTTADDLPLQNSTSGMHTVTVSSRSGELFLTTD